MDTVNYEKLVVESGEEVSASPLSVVILPMENEIVNIKSQDELPSVMDKFNLSLKKSKMLQVIAQEDIKNAALAQLKTKLENRPYEITTKENIDIIKTMSDVSSTNVKEINSVSEQPITLKQQNNNVTVNVNNGLSKESNDRVAEAIKMILKSATENTSIGLDIKESQTVEIENESKEE